jgi:hypothetical protein
VGSDYLFGNFLQFPAFRSRSRLRNPSSFSAELSWLERCECDYGAPVTVVIMPNIEQKVVPNNSQSDTQSPAPPHELVVKDVGLNRFAVCSNSNLEA